MISSFTITKDEKKIVEEAKARYSIGYTGLMLCGVEHAKRLEDVNAIKFKTSGYIDCFAKFNLVREAKRGGAVKAWRPVAIRMFAPNLIEGANTENMPVRVHSMKYSHNGKSVLLTYSFVNSKDMRETYQINVKTNSIDEAILCLIK